MAAATSLEPTPSGLPVRLSPTCLAARIAHRASPESSRTTLGDDHDTRRPSSQCVRQELDRVGEVVGCRTLCFSTPDDLESCGVAVPSRRSQRRLSDGSRPEKHCWRRCGVCLVCGSADDSLAVHRCCPIGGLSRLGQPAAAELDLRQRSGSDSCQPDPEKVIPPRNHPRARMPGEKTGTERD